MEPLGSSSLIIYINNGPLRHPKPQILHVPRLSRNSSGKSDFFPPYLKLNSEEGNGGMMKSPIVVPPSASVTASVFCADTTNEGLVTVTTSDKSGEKHGK